MGDTQDARLLFHIDSSPASSCASCGKLSVADFLPLTSRAFACCGWIDRAGCACAAPLVGPAGALAVNCTGLTQLNLSGCVGICGPGLAAVGECCPQLVHLDMSDCKQVRHSRPSTCL